MEGKVSVVLVLLPGTATSVDGTTVPLEVNGRSRFVFCTLELGEGGASCIDPEVGGAS